MGLFDELRRIKDAVTPDRIDDPVRGVAQVASTSRAPHNATSGTLSMRVVVQAEGLDPYQAEHHCICRTDRWPHVGERLPVEVDRTDPTRMRVLWDEVQTAADQGQARADAMLRSLTDGPVPGSPHPGRPTVHTVGTTTVQVHNVSGTADTEAIQAAVHAAESATGMDLDGDGRVGPPPAAPPPPPAAAPPAPTDVPAAPSGGGTDMVARLERLAQMRATGLLTDGEFEAAKAKVLAGE